MVSIGINLVMTVIGFAVSITFIVFVCTRLICARIQVNASRRSFLRASRSDVNILERGFHGLEPVIVANFPTRKYSDAFFTFGGNAQCAVCLGDYNNEDILRTLPPCGHFFHAACIDIWLRQHSTCPVCRMSLRGHSEKKHFMQHMFSSAIRAQNGMRCMSIHSDHCSSNGQRVPSVSHDSQRMEPNQEDCCHLEGGIGAAGECDSRLIIDCQVTKDSGNKQAESPSST